MTQAGTMEVIFISHSPILPKHLQPWFPFLTYHKPGLDDHGFIQQPPTIGLSASGLPLLPILCEILNQTNHLPV